MSVLLKKKNIAGATLLAETYGHPMYLGMKGAKELLEVLNNKLGLKVDLKHFDEKMKDIETEVTKKTKELNRMTRGKRKIDDINYIG